MLYFVDRHNRSQFAGQIEEMYRIRHRIYVDERGWKAIAKPDGREIDQFDTEDALYILALDDCGAVMGGTRLLPTTGPHLMRDVFAHTVTWGRVPCDARIYEISRYFVWGNLRREARAKLVHELLCGVLEFAMERGISHLSGVFDTFFIPRFLEGNWKIHHLGLPTEYPEGVCASFMLEVDRARLTQMHERFGIAGPSLFYSHFPPAYIDRRADVIAA